MYNDILKSRSVLSTSNTRYFIIFSISFAVSYISNDTCPYRYRDGNPSVLSERFPEKEQIKQELNSDADPCGGAGQQPDRPETPPSASVHANIMISPVNMFFCFFCVLRKTHSETLILSPENHCLNSDFSL